MPAPELAPVEMGAGIQPLLQKNNLDFRLRGNDRLARKTLRLQH